jgi:glucosylceramidase
LLTRLFSRDGNGIGLSCLRVPIGSSDFSLSAYTYEDEPNHFTIDHDKAYILPALRGILRTNADLTVLASPWTAPAHLKDNESLFGGSLKDRPGITEDYSEYLVNFIKAYEHEGLPVHAITLLNEPCNGDPNLPSMKLDWVPLVNIVVYALVDRFAKEAITTDIILYDHNWDNVEYALNLLADLQANHNRQYQVIAGTAFHCYGGTPDFQSRVHDVHPDKDIYLTECTGWHYQDQGPDDNFADDLVWETRNLIIGATRHWARSVILWNLALDPNGGPHLPTAGGEKEGKRCRGVVTIDNKSRYISYHVEYYVLGHASKFVKTGARRIESDTYDNAIETVAFQNPDGSIVLIVLNPTSEPQRFGVWQRDQSFPYTLDSRSVVTFRWN